MDCHLATRHATRASHASSPQVGVEEGVPDIYRDSLLRYLGYANEVGEAFRPLVPVELVYASYVLAIGYILADTVDKGKKGACTSSMRLVVFCHAWSYREHHTRHHTHRAFGLHTNQ